MVIVFGLSVGAASAQERPWAAPRIERFSSNPIIHPEMLPGADGENIAGPSLIRAPEWLTDPLGQYYLYFAHHEGRYIRLAYSDSLEGPWSIYEPGTLHLEQTSCNDVPADRVAYKHVASPDVHVDNEAQEIRMYFHCFMFIGGDPEASSNYPQMTLVARSKDGLEFGAEPEVLGRSYFRVFRRNSDYFALGMPGIFYRSRNGLTDFVEGPTLFTPNMRHSAVKVDGDTLLVLYTNAGANPERILLSQIELTSDWMSWQESEPVVVIEPELEWEGGLLPLRPSERGAVLEPVRQLRDPALYEEDGRSYLLYSVAGESGLAISEIHW